MGWQGITTGPGRGPIFPGRFSFYLEIYVDTFFIFKLSIKKIQMLLPLEQNVPSSTTRAIDICKQDKKNHHMQTI